MQPGRRRQGSQPFYLPAEDTDNLNVATLPHPARHGRQRKLQDDKDNKYSTAWETLERARDEYYKKLGNVLLKEL